jgi:cytochrome c biogenesis protein CcmG, thiol:disulfide interchange protein DsbE
LSAARRTGQIVALVGVVALLVVLILHLVRRSSPPKLGGPAPQFSLDRLDGDGTLSLASLRGKPVVINFFASWCEPCKREAPALERLWHTYRKQGVVFLGIDTNDARSDALHFLRAHGITYPTLRDARGLVAANGYDVANMPMTFFVSRTGRLVATTILGPVNEQDRTRQFGRAVKAAMGS